MSKQLSDGNPDGTKLGQDSSDLVSFYGVTAVAQPSTVTALTALTATTALSSGFGLSSASQMEALVQSVKDIKTMLRSLGLVQGTSG